MQCGASFYCVKAVGVCSAFCLRNMEILPQFMIQALNNNGSPRLKDSVILLNCKVLLNLTVRLLNSLDVLTGLCCLFIDSSRGHYRYLDDAMFT